MILILEIAMIIASIIVLVQGRVSVSKCNGSA